MQDGWLRLHPVTPVLRSVQLLYAFVIGALAAQFGGPTVPILVLAIALIAAWITTGYLRYRYKVTDDSIIIHHGVLFRQRRIIPRSRIQNIDLRAGLIQQMLSVVTARVETAGGQGTEALLQVVSRREGERLREVLMAVPGRSASLFSADAGEGADADATMIDDGAGVQATPSVAVVRRVSVLNLVIAGATSNRAGLLVAALLGGDYFLDFMPTDWLLARFIPPEYMAPETAAESLIQTAQHDTVAFVIGAGALVLFFGLAGWGLSIVGSVVRYFDFNLAGSDGELRVAYGLFTRREKGFRRKRVQNVQIERPILRRWLGLASLRVQTAGYGPGVKADERVETLTPITRTGDIGSYLSAVFPDFDWEGVEWRPSHPRARRRFFIRRALVVVPVTGLAVALLDPRFLLLLLALIPAWFLAAAHYRHLGHARSSSYVLTREGLWTQRTYIVPVPKIQALHLKQTPFQRRLGLGTVAIETAGNPYDWHEARSIDLSREYGLELMESLATQVKLTGLVF
jgi:putative membrane protein